jgi:exo-beta-1,3-glucanase (GH17 family)
MSIRTKLIIATALLGVASSATSLASAQSAGRSYRNSTPYASEFVYRPDQTDGAYHDNGNYFYEGIGLPQRGG